MSARAGIGVILLAGLLAGPWLHAAVAGEAAGEEAVTLDECIRVALSGNPGLKAVELRVEAARAAMRRARSAWWPRVGAQAGYQVTDNPPQAFMMSLNQRRLNMADPAFNPNEPDDTDNLRLSLVLSQRLFDGGRRGLDVEMAGVGEELRRDARDAARQQLAYETARAFIGVLQAEAFIRVEEAAVASLSESLRVAGERLAAGAAVKSDVLAVEVRLAAARQELVHGTHAARLARAALTAAAGGDPARGRALQPVTNATALPTLDFAVLESRPEMRMARGAVRLREADLRRAVREYAPVVNAFGSADWDSGDASDYEQSYMMGVAAELNIFDGSLSRGRVAEARAEVEAARAEAEDVMSRLRLDLESAWLQASDANERAGVAGQASGAAAEALRLTRERYEGGGADMTELLAAETARIEAEVRAVAARYEQQAALRNLYRAAGHAVVAGDMADEAAKAGG